MGIWTCTKKLNQEKTSSSVVFSFSYCCSKIETLRYFEVVTPCIWRLPPPPSPQYERQSKTELSCRNDTIRESNTSNLFFENSGFNLTRNNIKNNTAIFQLGDIPRTASELLDDGDPVLVCSLEAEMFRIFHFKKFWCGFWNYKFLFVDIQCLGNSNFGRVSRM